MSRVVLALTILLVFGVTAYGYDVREHLKMMNEISEIAMNNAVKIASVPSKAHHFHVSLMSNSTDGNNTSGSNKTEPPPPPPPAPPSTYGEYTDYYCKNQTFALTQVMLECPFVYNPNATINVTTYCAVGGCADRITAAFVALTNCQNRNNIESENKASSFVSYIRLPCLTDSSGKNCYATFQRMQGPQNSSDELTVGQLETLCTPCAQRLISYLSMGSSEGSGGIALNFQSMCMKDTDGKFCLIKFQTMTGEPTPEFMCTSTCFAQQMKLAHEMGHASKDMLNMYQLMQEMACMKNGAGTACMSVLQTLQGPPDLQS